MRWLWLVALLPACSNAFLACGRGGGGGPCCGAGPGVARNTSYEGALRAADGGTQTRLKVMVTANGAARLTFTRDGQEIVKVFEAHQR
ncbi:MAG: hypothetical protein Q8L48_32550 [Archangium sp.]|nr:hypothetical protein [Archangium sp.]